MKTIQDKIVLSTLETYLVETQLCIDYDLGYPAIHMIETIIKFWAHYQLEKMPDLLEAVELLIDRMSDFNWLVQPDENISDTVVDLILGFTSIGKSHLTAKGPFLVQNIGRLDDNVLQFNAPAIILDKFFEAIKEVVNDRRS
jgi:hypothetical protein